MSEKTLLVLAAGMGSRFGGLKQIEPIDENGNFIIDYSIYDAIRAGFKKVVFVIKEENYEDFKTTIGKRIENKIKVEYAFQKKESYVEKDIDITQREKPWGTGHAVLCAKDRIEGDFAIINADDFYGFESYKKAVEFIDNNKNSNTYAIIAYKIGNTLAENGSVKRGLCSVKNNLLCGIKECSVERVDGKIKACPLGESESFYIEEDHPTSMNFMCLNSSFFEYLEKDFKKFLNKTKDLIKDECLIQNVMFNKSQEDGSKIFVVDTPARWFGVTYREDKPALVNAIKNLVDKGLYPKNLWGKD